MPFEQTAKTKLDVARLTELFLACPVGETVTFKQMSEAIGRDVLARRYFMQRAILAANLRSGALYISERSVGYKRLHATEATTIGSKTRRHIRNTSRRAANGIVRAVAHANDLTANEQARVSREVSALRLIGFLASDRAVADGKPRKNPTPVGQTFMEMGRRMGLLAAA